MSKIAILNAGGQYCHLIARKIRELGVFTEITDFNTPPDNLVDVSGIVLSGGPQSVYIPDSPRVAEGLFDLGVPILGLCYGHQLIAHLLGGKVHGSKCGEYGIADIKILNNDSLFKGLADTQTVWMSHGDSVEQLPEGFEVLASSDTCSVAAMAHPQRHIYGLQFHPEVVHTPRGQDIIRNFVFNLCKVTTTDWRPKDQIDTLIGNIRDKAKGRKVIFLVSGGVDSTVAFYLCVRALGKEHVRGIYIDTGLMRKNETLNIISDFKAIGADNIDVVDASHKFIDAIGQECNPERKREIIGRMFIEVEDDLLDKIESSDNNWILGQGTIYPDTIESGCSTNASRIKTHHNRVDKILKLISEDKVVEPLIDFYKDEVRLLAGALGLPQHMIMRDPFPGPGLAVRCICCTEDKPTYQSGELTDVLLRYGLSGFIAPAKTVGVQGDSRSYKDIAILYGDIAVSQLEGVASAIVNGISGINRVAYVVKGRSEIRPELLAIHPAYLTHGRVELLREADYIVKTFTVKYKGQLPDIWQFPVVIFPLGYDDASARETIVLRPVLSTDGMTARFAQIDRGLLQSLAGDILRLEGIAMILYDITNKPPGTIEWE
ncbi:glutamine-hydrolyzing GMP synthase [Candidatus Magnetobacterium casense]|uniref:Glutamine-hydrolyzing GMP synthase n=1 Tax=Candidatus Magnetobacterium casense TaxID=1455061 RepID=A0ABS6RTR2_9BACT|nr:glutamine-hydrolyzing GMP synthase [Candidatus Magnetobacterium casensis]MBV6340006.1 glutamine-hydrolyzing GMP synthase [Candidatus Magnetobacterium casensis]